MARAGQDLWSLGSGLLPNRHKPSMCARLGASRAGSGEPLLFESFHSSLLWP